MIDNLDSRKSGTFVGIPTNCLKGLSDIPAKLLHTVRNDEVLKGLKFLRELTIADFVPAFKKKTQIYLRTIEPSVFCQLSSRCSRELCLIKLPPI